MKKIILFNVAVALAIATAFGQQSKLDINQFYPMDAGHSYIEFSIKYMGYAKVKGRFSEFAGMFRYDESDLSNTSVIGMS